MSAVIQATSVPVNSLVYEQQTIRKSRYYYIAWNASGKSVYDKFALLCVIINLSPALSMYFSSYLNINWTLHYFISKLWIWVANIFIYLLLLKISSLEVFVAQKIKTKLLSGFRGKKVQTKRTSRQLNYLAIISCW